MTTAADELTARRASLRNLLDRAARGILVSPGEGALLRQHVEAEIREADTARAEARRLHAQTCPLAQGAVSSGFTCSLCDALGVRPAATQATEAATSPLRDLIAAAIYERNNPAHQWADAHPDDLLAYGFDADAVLAVIQAPAHNDGPSVEECREADRTWAL